MSATSATTTRQNSPAAYRDAKAVLHSFAPVQRDMTEAQTAAEAFAWFRRAAWRSAPDAPQEAQGSPSAREEGVAAGEPGKARQGPS